MALTEIRVCGRCHNTTRKHEGTLMSFGWATNLETGERTHFPSREKHTYGDELCDYILGQMIEANADDGGYCNADWWRYA